MKKGIYISGPITNNSTGLPKDGWREPFYEAEKKLRSMGYHVISPTDISNEVEEEWTQMLAENPWNRKPTKKMSKLPTRATYVNACLEVMNVESLAGRLHGVYLIGEKQCIRYSHGVQMELHMAKMLRIPIFYADCDGNEIDIHLLPVKHGLRLDPDGCFGNENWSKNLNYLK